MAYRAKIPERKFGLEIEGFGLSRRKVEEIIRATGEPTYQADRPHLLKWTIGKDSTIKGKHPVEIQSPALCFADRERIKKVVYALSDGGLQHDDSCALHIHWDVKNYTGWALANLMRLYTKFEPLIDCFVDKQRRGDSNQHCRSLFYNGIWEWLEQLSGAKPAYQVAKEFEQEKPLSPVTSFPSARHYKLNVCAINKYGTVEFRQHEGTFNFWHIQHWILLTGLMVHRAEEGSRIEMGPADLSTFWRTLGVSNYQLGPQNRSFWEKDVFGKMREFYRGRYRDG